MISTRARALFIALAVAPGLAQCDRREREPAPEAPQVTAPVAPLGQVTAMNRGELVNTLARAASAYAAGETEAGEPLNGRRFAVRLPFGCQGAGETSMTLAPGLAYWRRANSTRDIELILEPADWLASPVLDGGAALNEAWSGVEGFWIARPWLALETCPPIREASAPPQVVVADDDAETSGVGVAPPPLPTIALADPLTSGLAAYTPLGGSRVGRREGQPYVYVVRGEAEAPAQRPERGWRVLLEGRIGTFPDGRSIRCRAASRDQRPVCIAAVQVDKVAFEDASSGRQLAEWRPG